MAAETVRSQQDRLEAVTRPGAGGLWACFPSAALGLKLTSAEFRVATLYWLGLPTSPMGVRGTTALLDRGADQITRHDSIRDVLFESAKAVGLRPWREAQVDASRSRPGDVYLPNWSFGRALAIDVTVSHPSQAAVSNTARAEASASVRAAAKAAHAKVNKHGARCAAQGVDFLPLAVCSFGGWLPEGVEFVNTLAQRVAMRSGLSQSVASVQLWQRLSVTLWRSNARAILHREPQGVLAVGTCQGMLRAARRGTA